MLTPREKQLVDFISAYIAENGGIGPSYNEMCAGIGIKSKSSISRLVTQLESKGILARLPHRARCIAIIDHPDVTRLSEQVFLSAALKMAQELRTWGEAGSETIELFLKAYDRHKDEKEQNRAA